MRMVQFAICPSCFMTWSMQSGVSMQSMQSTNGSFSHRDNPQIVYDFYHGGEAAYIVIADFVRRRLQIRTRWNISMNKECTCVISVLKRLYTYNKQASLFRQVPTPKGVGEFWRGYTYACLCICVCVFKYLIACLLFMMLKHYSVH